MSGIRYKSHIKPCAETSIRYGKNPSVPPARVVLLFRLRGDILFFIERLFLTLWQIYTRGPRDIRTEDVHKRRTRDKRFDREKIQQFFFFFYSFDHTRPYQLHAYSLTRQLGVSPRRTYKSLRAYNICHSSTPLFERSKLTVPKK